jgi:hypothetical protein
MRLWNIFAKRRARVNREDEKQAAIKKLILLTGMLEAVRDLEREMHKRRFFLKDYKKNNRPSSDLADS